MRYGDPGWLCVPCQTSHGDLSNPTLRQVVVRIYLRWAAGKPVSLNNQETAVLAEAVLASDPYLVPERRSRDASTPGATAAAWKSWSQLDTSAEEVVGYMLDAVASDFACNLMTASAMNLLRHIAHQTYATDRAAEFAFVYELLNLVSMWETLDWRDPLRRAGFLQFIERFPRSTLPSPR